MKNILPVSNQKVIKFTLPSNSWKRQRSDDEPSFNGLHIIYNGRNPDELFSIFTSDIINHSTGSKK